MKVATKRIITFSIELFKSRINSYFDTSFMAYQVKVHIIQLQELSNSCAHLSAGLQYQYRLSNT